MGKFQKDIVVNASKFLRLNVIERIMDGHVNLFRGILISLGKEHKLVYISAIVFTTYFITAYVCCF